MEALDSNMEVDTLNIIRKPIYENMSVALSSNDETSIYLIDAQDEHYYNRKIIYKIINRLKNGAKAFFLCRLTNISSVISCFNEQAFASIDIKTFVTKGSQEPLFLVKIVDVHKNEQNEQNKQISSCKIFKKNEDFFDFIFEDVLYNSLERDIITCIGIDCCNRFCKRIKESCRYFVGISPSDEIVVNEYLHQSIRILRRL